MMFPGDRDDDWEDPDDAEFEEDARGRNGKMLNCSIKEPEERELNLNPKTQNH